MKNYKKIFLGLIILVMLLIATPALAISYLLEGISCIENGLCTLCDLIQVGINGVEILLGLSGVVVFVLFIYGGVLWMISFGNNQKIEKGKSIMQAAVIGMVIMLFSYFLVELLWQALRGNETFSNTISCDPIINKTNGVNSVGELNKNPNSTSTENQTPTTITTTNNNATFQIFTIPTK